jgi:hypothetical protein
MALRKITEDDLARVMELDTRAEDLELLVLRLGRKGYPTQEDLALMTTIAVEMRKAGVIMRRFLTGRTEDQVVIEPGKGFVAAGAKGDQS